MVKGMVCSTQGRRFGWLGSSAEALLVKRGRIGDRHQVGHGDRKCKRTFSLGALVTAARRMPFAFAQIRSSWSPVGGHERLRRRGRRVLAPSASC